MREAHPNRLLALGVGLVVAGLVGGWLWLAGGEERAGGDRSVATHETPRFRFSYPAGWHRVRGVDFPLTQLTGTKGVGEHTFGLDLENWVTVYHADAQIRVDQGNVSYVLRAADRLVRRVLDDVPRARVLQRPFALTRGGLPGYRYRAAAANQRGRQAETSVTTVYRGRDAYVVGCSARPDRIEAITAGCEQVIESLKPGLAVQEGQ